MHSVDSCAELNTRDTTNGCLYFDVQVRQFLRRLKRERLAEQPAVLKPNLFLSDEIDSKRRKELDLEIMQWQAIHKV